HIQPVERFRLPGLARGQPPFTAEGNKRAGWEGPAGGPAGDPRPDRHSPEQPHEACAVQPSLLRRSPIRVPLEADAPLHTPQVFLSDECFFRRQPASEYLAQRVELQPPSRGRLQLFRLDVPWILHYLRQAHAVAQIARDGGTRA